MSFLCQQIYLNLSYTRNGFLKKKKEKSSINLFTFSNFYVLFSSFHHQNFSKEKSRNVFWLFFKKCIYLLWLHWVLSAVRGLSLVVESGGCSSLWSLGSSLWWLLFLQGIVSRYAAFSSYSMQVQSL